MNGHRRHVYECPISWGDMDAFGHVNNVNFLRYLEDARAAMLFLDAVNAGLDGMASLVVSRHEVDYRRPLQWRAEPVRVETWVCEIRPARFTLGYQVCDDEAVYVEASSVLVAYDFDGQRPRRLSEQERAFLEGYLDGAAG